MIEVFRPEVKFAFKAKRNDGGTTYQWRCRKCGMVSFCTFSSGFDAVLYGIAHEAMHEGHGEAA